MHKSSSKILSIIFIIHTLLILDVNTLKPTTPVIASPNTQSAPANIIFNFQLSKPMITTSYLMIVFPIFPSLITPFTCTLLSSAFKSKSCINLNTASDALVNPLTINKTAVNNINPNIQPILTIVVSFDNTLLASTPYSIQIVLSNNLPSIGALSQSFEMYVISGTGIMQQQNWNMGQLYFELTNNNVLSVVSINAQNQNLPGTTVSTLIIDITIGIACPTPISTFIFTISGKFQFTVSSLLSTITVLNTPPQILSMTVISRNIIKVLFNQQFAVGRSFRVSISNIYNPLQISQGAISVYYLPYNSISPIQVSQSSIPYQTVSYTPAITILTAQGISPTAPIEFYLSSIQYITVTILLPRNFETNFILQISSDVLLIHRGSVYAKTSTINSNTLKYILPDEKTVQISGFSILPSGTLITVTMRAWINTNPIFKIDVSIDKAEHISLNAPIIYGTSSATVTGQSQSFITGLTGNGGQTNKLTAMQTNTSFISFTINPTFQTLSGSFLQIYTSNNLIADPTTFSSSSSCLLNSVAQACTIMTNTQYTIITISSTSSTNLYPQLVPTPIIINNLKFKYASSHSSYFYQFYFQLTVSLATNGLIKKYLATPMVVQERNLLPNFKNYISNNIYNTGSNFLNIFRIVSPTIAQFQNIIQPNQKRIISIFSYQGWKPLFTTLTSYSSYPCGSNINAEYTYIQGSNSLNLTTDYPLNWDRINIVLPGTEATTKFSIIIPTQFITPSPFNSSYAILYQIMIGIVDTTNGAITYLHSEPMPTSTPAITQTYLIPQNILVYSKPKKATMQLNIAGLTGSYKSSIDFTVSPSSLFSGTSYSTALIVMSSWQFYDSTTSLSSTSLASANPIFINVEQTPICIKISSTSFLTYIPFKTTGAYTTDFNIRFDNIKLPYSLDLPYYSVSLIDETGSLDGYNEFINQDQGIFYTGPLKNLTITCDDNSLGVTNTYCFMNFIPFQQIEVKAILIVNLYGLFVSTNLCTMMDGTTNIPISSCTPNTNLNILTITLNNQARLPSLRSYSLKVNGISIDASQILNYVQLMIKDPTGSYTIQQKSVILLTSVPQNFPIYINQVNLAIHNPVVTSELYINFTLPRFLDSDESFALAMSTDFTNLNNIPSKIRIRLMQADGITQIPTQWLLKSINSQIIFQGLQNTLVASSYSLQMYGIITPSTVTQDMIKIIYLRNYDNTFSKSNTLASTATFPSLVQKVNSLITLQTYFNTEGLEHEMQFTIINQYIQVTQVTKWIVNFPRYYSTLIWNQDHLIYCMINKTPLTCRRSMYTPYQIQITQSPLIINVGDTYVIRVYGIPCPRASYINGNSLFVTQSIFFAMLQSSSATKYSDYSQLFLTNTVVNPQTSVGYGSIIVKSISSSNLQVYANTFFTIDLICSIAISVNQWIFITLPKQFDNLNNIYVTVQTQINSGLFQVYEQAEVVNTRIGYQLKTNNIAANTKFQIIITSLLTPKQPITIDMNFIKILIAATNRLTTLATSIQSKNELGELTFLPSTLHLVVNNYNPIYITFGTYSTPINLKSSDNSPFSTNMQISFQSSSMQFISNPTYLYLGSQSTTFQIGVEQNTVPTAYSFNIIKKQTSISASYSILSTYAVIVRSIPVIISFPAAFTVPIGGCSMPVPITLTNLPYSSVNIFFQYDTSTIIPSKFWIKQQISNQVLSFDLSNPLRYISFCSSTSMTASTFDIKLQLGGDNAASYSLSTSKTTINVVSNPSINLTPTFTLTVANAQKTYTNFKIVTNIPGLCFYHIKLAPLTTPLTIYQITTLVKQNKPIISSNNDYMTTKIYAEDRFEKVGYSSILIAGDNFFSVEDLLPQRQYVLCAYFQSQFDLIANYQCVNFMTQTWGTIQKTYIRFNKVLLANQLNNLLCFMVRASNSKINQIVDEQGRSCSLATSPVNYNYNFIGNTTGNAYTKATIYHIASPNLTTDGATSAFSALFDANGLTSSNLVTAQTSFSVDFISTSALLTSFDPLIAIKSSSSLFQPSFTINVDSYVFKSAKIQISRISGNVYSSLYMILVSHKNITTNQITSETKISIKQLVTPTNDQVASCVDGTNYPAIQCMRVVMQPDNVYSVTFDNIVDDSVYALYYTIANEYPLRPVFYEGVKKQLIITASHQRLAMLSIVIMLLVMILM